MSLSPEQEALLGRVFEAYVAEHHCADILQLNADSTEEMHQAVVVNAMTLFEASMEVGDFFIAYPTDVLAVFDKVLNRSAIELLEKASQEHHTGPRAKEQGLRHTLHARITGLPVCPELTRDTIPRSRDVGHFLSVTGTVIRTSVAKVLEYQRDYMCAKCRHVFTAQADFDQFYTITPPVTCPNPEGCNSYKFTCLSGGSEPATCKDYQEIKIQEQVQRLSVGSIPRSMVVALEDDLVDNCKSGDDVTVYGVMCQRWRPFRDGSRCEVELVLRANNIEVTNQQAATALLMKDAQKEFEDFWSCYKHDPLAGRNQILLSLCPQVFGMYVVKLAVAMVLAGGVQRIDLSGTKIRGECHMLLVGDPGTGKSQFLKYAAKIMPRSVLTAGIGSTSAGLTVAAVKDGGDWHLEAGALVLSDGGLCCIDEFNSIKEHDRISIHEAMEQQSISVAKAGMVCKLNTRTTILAATNPKGQYDPNEALSVNVALASPLLSRFDLVLVLLDTRNPEWDRVISSFILEDTGLPTDSSNLWSMEKMKTYFTVIKRLQPQVSEEANAILTRYYQRQRQSDGRNAARTTIRMLESLSRLAEAHARLMHRETVSIEDAVMAVSVMECSMQGGALLGSVNALLTSFPADPSLQYQSQCQILLEGLNLPQLLHKEQTRLARLKITPETSQSDSMENDNQHRLQDTDSLTPTVHRGLTRNKGEVPVDSSLDWFHSITSSLSSDDPTSPKVTSTQDNHTGQQASAVVKQPNWHTEMNVGRNNLTSDGDDASQKEKTIKGTGENRKKTPNQKEARDEFVIQKVSKNLRDRRLELKQQQCEEGGGCGQKEASGGKASKCTAGAATSSSLSSDSPVQGNLCSSKPSRSESESTKSISTVLKEQAVDAQVDLQAKLSGFVFKPRKMRPPGPDIDALSVSGAFLPGAGRDHTGTGGRESKRAAEAHHQRQPPSKRGGSVSEVGDGRSQAICSTVKEVETDTSAQGQRLSGVKESGRKDQRVFVCGETEGRRSAGAPASNSTGNTNHPAPSKSAAAKLSRFAFTCTTEPTTTAPSRVEERGEVKRALDPELPGGQVRHQGAPSAAPASHSRGNGPFGCGSTASLKKRKCFELGPAPTTAGLVSGLSLFDSEDLGNDVFDTDWDREVSKKAKV